MSVTGSVLQGKQRRVREIRMQDTHSMGLLPQAHCQTGIRRISFLRPGQDYKPSRNSPPIIHRIV